MTKKKQSTSEPDKMLDDMRLIENFLTKEILFTIFEAEFAKGNKITPDVAIKEVETLISLFIAKTYNAPNWLSAVQNHDFPLYPPDALRDAHHVAVDLYYELYYGVQNRGAPHVSYFHLIHIVRLTEEGLTPLEIAKRFNWPTDTPEERAKSSDRIKKNLRVARERLPLITLPAKPQGKKKT